MQPLLRYPLLKAVMSSTGSSGYGARPACGRQLPSEWRPHVWQAKHGGGSAPAIDSLAPQLLPPESRSDSESARGVVQCQRGAIYGLRAVALYSHDMCMCMYDACQRVQHIFNTPSKLQNTSGERCPLLARVDTFDARCPLLAGLQDAPLSTPVICPHFQRQRGAPVRATGNTTLPSFASRARTSDCKPA
eukprot:scaffold90850_cov69-Phaeocystis_antarctica.AAC.8